MAAVYGNPVEIVMASTVTILLVAPAANAVSAM
jgi:hypothetical protein